MLKIFRKIRKKLLVQNKPVDYLKYSIGEIVLVVIGILIALQVNNWNDERKQNLKKQELIENLITDFEATYTKFDDVAKETDSLIHNMDLFSELLEQKDAVPVDSLKYLARAFFQMMSFEPNLTFYDQAENNGDLDLLDSKELFIKVDLFKERNTMQAKLMDNFLKSYTNGYIWDLRKSVGTINNLKADSSSSFFWIKSKTQTHEEYYELMTSSIVIAAMQTHRQLSITIQGDLILLRDLSMEILEILREEREKLL